MWDQASVGMGLFSVNRGLVSEGNFFLRGDESIVSEPKQPKEFRRGPLFFCLDMAFSIIFAEEVQSASDGDSA